VEVAVTTTTGGGLEEAVASPASEKKRKYLPTTFSPDVVQPTASAVPNVMKSLPSSVQCQQMAAPPHDSADISLSPNQASQDAIRKKADQDVFANRIAMKATQKATAASAGAEKRRQA
jgi:hypothetical protein